jgi:hypothetical protein
MTVTETVTKVEKSKTVTVIGLLGAIAALLLSPEYIDVLPAQLVPIASLISAILAALGAPLTKKS